MRFWNDVFKCCPHTFGHMVCIDWMREHELDQKDLQATAEEAVVT